MSLRKKLIKSYNRAEEKEDTFYFLELLADEEFIENRDWWVHDVAYHNWNYNDWRPGCVESVDELYQLRLLTLLRSLNVKSSFERLAEKYW